MKLNSEGLTGFAFIVSIYALAVFDALFKGNGTNSGTLCLLASVHVWVALRFDALRSRCFLALSCVLILIIAYAEATQSLAMTKSERTTMEILLSCFYILAVYFGADWLLKAFERQAQAGSNAIEIVRNELLTVQKTEELVRGRFLGLMSHELRTPLTTMKAAVTLMRHPKATSHRKSAYLDTLESSIDSMTAVVGDLLLTHKSQSSTTVLRETPTDLAALCQLTCEAFRAAAEKNGTQLNFSTVMEHKFLLADGECLQQMLGHLLKNAVWHTHNGVILVELSKQSLASHEHSTLTFSVSDNGCGVSEIHQKDLFKMFSHLQSETNNNPSMGLGLFMVQTLAKRMGGDAGFLSKSGQGSRFWFSVRLRPVE